MGASSAFREHPGQTAVMLLISLLILFAAILASEIFAKTLSRPLLKLVDTMKEIQKDSLTSRKVELKGADELVTLGNIFNSMLDSIHDAVDDLRCGFG